MKASAERYTAVAIVLHWAIAAAILFMAPLGFWMHQQAHDGNVSEGVYRAFQLHKSVGLTILALSLVRLGWRLANPPPPLPEHMPGWERWAAKATHWAFYLLMLAVPLSGWLFVSAGWSLHEDRSLAVATRWFGLIEAPALFGLPQASDTVRATVAQFSFRAHSIMAWGMIALLALHVAAALKHHLFDKDNVLAQMIPGLKAPFAAAPPPKDPVRLAIIGGGLGLTALALVILASTAATFGRAPPPQQSSSFEAPATASGPAPIETTETEATSPTLETAPAPSSQQRAQEPANAQPQAPATWRVDTGASSVRFAYVYSDESGRSNFGGRFTRWRADIRFDPDNLEGSSVNATFETASAATGVALHDNTLSTAAWFNSANHPTASFRSTDIRRRDGGYEARGRLTIRGVTADVRLPFTLTVQGDRAVMDGQVSINRSDFGIGEDADGDDMISNEVRVSVHVEATRAP